MADPPKKQTTGTLKALKLSRSNLSDTLRAQKSEQEALQTALARAASLTPTAKFRLAELQQHGSGSLAYSSLQEGMQYYMYEKLGYLAYVPLSDSPHSVLVLADPICKNENLKAFIDEFLKVKNDPIFLHIAKPTATVLNELGYCVNELGVETFIEIQDFELVGNKKQQLRAARNRAQKDGIKVREITSTDEAMMAALRKISKDWLKDKVASDNQMKLVVRPLVLVDEVDVRKFVAIKDNELIGFVIFDPMYFDGEVIGYIANQLRSNYEKGYSVVDCIILEAIQQFKTEGKKELSLGLSPMAKVDDSDEFKHSKILKAHFKYAFEKANYLYNFKNLARHKNQYRPEMKGAREEKVYCAMKTRFLLPRMLGVYKALGLDPVKKTLAHYAEVIEEKIDRFLHPRQAEIIRHNSKEESKTDSE